MSGFIIQLKNLFTGKQLFPKTKSEAVYDDDLGRLDQVLKNEMMRMVDATSELGEQPDVRDADTLCGYVPNDFAKVEDLKASIFILLADNWVEQSDGTFTYTLAVPSITAEDLLEVSMYMDGSETETQIEEYNEYITTIDTYDGEIVLTAVSAPTTSFSIIVNCNYKIDGVVVANLSDLVAKYDEIMAKLNSMS